ncbi:MAG: hypothetical protein AAFV45_12710 [Pseudomonadota bacterium]
MAAVLVTFFCTPEAYSRTIGWVETFAEHRYGPDLLPLVSAAYFVILSLMIFFTARASVATLIVMGGLTLATKFV